MKNIDPPLFSVVCVYNDEKILEDYLLKGLSDQDCSYETLLIDNRNGSYVSAASAFNSVLQGAKGRYVIFSHQDIFLGRSDSLSQIEKTLEGWGENVVAGIAGKKEGSWTISNITHGDPPSRPGKTGVQKAEKVQTFDECFYVVSKKLLDRSPFDEVTCSGWHLYAVDYCLSVENYATVLVLPLQGIHHKGGNSFDLGGYYQILKKVAGKHRGDVKKIYTTCGDWPTNELALDLSILRHRFRRRSRQFRHYLRRVGAGLMKALSIT